jgi:hypothetical protein
MDNSGGVSDALSASAHGFSVCGTSLFCEDPSTSCGFSSVSSLFRVFCPKLGGIFSCFEGDVVSPCNTLGKPLRPCLWKVRRLVCKSDDNTCTLSNTSS